MPLITAVFLFQTFQHEAPVGQAGQGIGLLNPVDLRTEMKQLRLAAVVRPMDVASITAAPQQSVARSSLHFSLPKWIVASAPACHYIASTPTTPAHLKRSGKEYGPPKNNKQF
jgi:hypothetical protein